jgi:hypothetical protein
VPSGSPSTTSAGFVDAGGYPSDWGQGSPPIRRRLRSWRGYDFRYPEEGSTMNEPIATWSHEFSVVLGCPHPEDKSPCYIPLPRQSLLGTFEGQHCLPKGEWPATFLCLRHGRAFVCFPDSIHLEIDIRLPGQPVSSLWRIECECAHENCGKLHSIYTAGEKDWPTIVRRILRRNPLVPCCDHKLLWREDLMRGTEYPHSPPVR